MCRSPPPPLSKHPGAAPVPLPLSTVAQIIMAVQLFKGYKYLLNTCHNANFGCKLIVSGYKIPREISSSPLPPPRTKLVIMYIPSSILLLASFIELKCVQ